MQLIDANAFQKFIEKQDESEDYERYRFEEWLEQQPTIEAKPVVHAHWEDIGLETKHKFCTKCGGYVTQRESWVYKYCPCCGAQMDESISCSHEDDTPFSQARENGVKIPVISMEDVPKIAKEMEK